MSQYQSSYILWLWLLPLICNGTIQFGSFSRSSVVQEGELRLAGSTKQSEGRVEIYHDGQWGTICDDGWDLKEAQVVCRQLKFPGAKSVVTGEVYAKASGPIWMDDMECMGTEKYLHTCKFKGWGVTDCTHKEDVGVVCDTANASLPHSTYILDHRVVLFDQMDELFNSGAFCDLSITAQSSSTDDQAGTLQTDTVTVCAHKAILSHVGEFNMTEDTRNITVQVVQSCLPHFSSFIRYLYTRKIEVTVSSVQCLHWLSSKFGVEQLKRDTSLLFNQVLPDDGSFETPVSVYEYAVETNDFVLQEMCVQYMAWNFQNFLQSPAWPHISVDLLSSLLVRSDLVVQEELFVLKAVENWLLNNANISLDIQVKVLSLVRFPMIPAEKLTMTYMSNSSLYSTHKAFFDENMLKALQFNVQLLTYFRSNAKMFLDDICYKPRIYTMLSLSFGPYSSHLPYDGQSKSMNVPYHMGLIFQDRTVTWIADVFSSQRQCSNRGVRCASLPMARLTAQIGYQPGVVFQKRLLLRCEGRYIGQIQDFKNNVVSLAKNITQSMTYPCQHDRHTFIVVVTPELI